MIVFIEPECRNCFYRLYRYGKDKAYYDFLDEEPVPNCSRGRCLIDGEDITKFINCGWVIKRISGKEKK